MFGVWHSVVNVITRRVRYGQINRIIQGRVGGVTWNWECKWEARTLRASVNARLERQFQSDRDFRLPIQAKRGVTYFVEQVQVLNRGVIDAERGADAGLARTAKDLAQCPFAKTGRISKADARSEIVVVRWSERARNTGISRNNPTERRGRELSRLQAGHDGLDFALGVIPRHADFPAQTQIERQVRLHLVGVLRVCAPITRARIQKLLTALVIAGRRAQ